MRTLPGRLSAKWNAQHSRSAPQDKVARVRRDTHLKVPWPTHFLMNSPNGFYPVSLSHLITPYETFRPRYSWYQYITTLPSTVSVLALPHYREYSRIRLPRTFTGLVRLQINSDLRLAFKLYAKAGANAPRDRCGPLLAVIHHALPCGLVPTPKTRRTARAGVASREAGGRQA